MSADQNLPGKSLGDAGLNVPLDPPPQTSTPNSEPQTVVMPAQPDIGQIIGGAVQLFREISTEPERIRAEARIKIAETEGNNIRQIVGWLMIIIAAIVVLAFVLVFRGFNDVALQIISLVVGFLGGMGFGKFLTRKGDS